MRDMKPWLTLVPQLVLLLAFMAVLVIHAPHGVPFGLDDHGQYLNHARALTEGRPYTDIDFIYTTYNNNIGPTVEPPGIPVLIAPLLTASDENLTTVRLFLAAWLLAVAWLAWRFSSRQIDGPGPLSVGLLVLATFSGRHVFDGVMSDVAFVAAVWTIILAADGDDQIPRGRLVVMAIAGVAAFAFRSAALALLPSMGLYILFRPRSEWPGLVAVGLTWVVAALLLFLGTSAGAEFGAEALARSWHQLLDEALVNLGAMKLGATAAFTYPFGTNALDDLWHVVALILSIAGAWHLFRRRPRHFAWFFTACYFVMLLIVPVGASRYWWPLVPLQWLTLVIGFRVMTKAAPRKAVGLAGGAAVTVLCIVSVIQAKSVAPPLFARSGMTQLTSALQSAASLAPVRVSFFSPRLFTWETRIPAMGTFEASPDATVAELRAKGITHLVVGSLGEHPQRDSSMQRAVAARSDAFERLGDFGELVLYRVLPGRQ